MLAYIRECMKEGTQVTRFNTLSAAALGAPAHFFFYFTFKYVFHLPYENFVLRLIATLLCLAIILKDKLPAFVKSNFPLLLARVSYFCSALYFYGQSYHEQFS